jgi:hypothetical protein
LLRESDFVYAEGAQDDIETVVFADADPEHLLASAPKMTVHCVASLGRHSVRGTLIHIMFRKISDLPKAQF